MSDNNDYHLAKYVIDVAEHDAALSDVCKTMGGPYMIFVLHKRIAGTDMKEHWVFKEMYDVCTGQVRELPAKHVQALRALEKLAATVSSTLGSLYLIDTSTNLLGANAREVEKTLVEMKEIWSNILTLNKNCPWFTHAVHQPIDLTSGRLEIIKNIPVEINLDFSGAVKKDDKPAAPRNQLDEPTSLTLKNPTCVTKVEIIRTPRFKPMELKKDWFGNSYFDDIEIEYDLKTVPIKKAEKIDDDEDEDWVKVKPHATRDAETQVKEEDWEHV